MRHKHERRSHAGLISVSPGGPTVVRVHLANSEKEIRSLRSTQLKNKLAGVLVAAIFAALLLPALAGAQTASPSDQQYSGNLEQVTPSGGSGTENLTGGGSGGGGGGGVSPSGGSGGLGGNVGPLPFTGFDVIAMAAVALAVTGLGLALQRAVSRDTGDGIS